MTQARMPRSEPETGTHCRRRHGHGHGPILSNGRGIRDSVPGPGQSHRAPRPEPQAPGPGRRPGPAMPVNKLPDNDSGQSRLAVPGRAVRRGSLAGRHPGRSPGGATGPLVAMVTPPPGPSAEARRLAAGGGRCMTQNRVARHICDEKTAPRTAGAPLAIKYGHASRRRNESMPGRARTATAESGPLDSIAEDSPLTPTPHFE